MRDRRYIHHSTSAGGKALSWLPALFQAEIIGRRAPPPGQYIRRTRLTRPQRMSPYAFSGVRFGSRLRHGGTRLVRMAQALPLPVAFLVAQANSGSRAGAS